MMTANDDSHESVRCIRIFSRTSAMETLFQHGYRNSFVNHKPPSFVTTLSRHTRHNTLRMQSLAEVDVDIGNSSLSSSSLLRRKRFPTVRPVHLLRPMLALCPYHFTGNVDGHGPAAGTCKAIATSVQIQEKVQQWTLEHVGFRSGNEHCRSRTGPLPVHGIRLVGCQVLIRLHDPSRHW